MSMLSTGADESFDPQCWEQLLQLLTTNMALMTKIPSIFDPEWMDLTNAHNNHVEQNDWLIVHCSCTTLQKETNMTATTHPMLHPPTSSHIPPAPLLLLCIQILLPPLKPKKSHHLTLFLQTMFNQFGHWWSLHLLNHHHLSKNLYFNDHHTPRMLHNVGVMM